MRLIPSLREVCGARILSILRELERLACLSGANASKASSGGDCNEDEHEAGEDEDDRDADAGIGQRRERCDEPAAQEGDGTENGRCGARTLAA